MQLDKHYTIWISILIIYIYILYKYTYPNQEFAEEHPNSSVLREVVLAFPQTLAKPLHKQICLRESKDKSNDFPILESPQSLEATISLSLSLSLHVYLYPRETAVSSHH